MIPDHIVHLEEQSAQLAWNNFRQGNCVDIRGRHLDTFIGDWQRSAGGAGPVLSARVFGPDGLEAVRLFPSAQAVTFGSHPRRLPGMDYSVPGRVACVWQSNGVWVELWHPDTPAAPYKPPQAAPAPDADAAEAGVDPFGVRRILAYTTARLPYTRNPRKDPTP